VVSHRGRHRNPGGASVFRVEDPGKSGTHLLSCAAALVRNYSPMSRVFLTHSAVQAVDTFGIVLTGGRVGIRSGVRAFD
jgi:hypothetical protein